MPATPVVGIHLNFCSLSYVIFLMSSLGSSLTKNAAMDTNKELKLTSTSTNVKLFSESWRTPEIIGPRVLPEARHVNMNE